MKIRVVSDTHIDSYWPNKQKRIFDILLQGEADVVVVAGDLAHTFEESWMLLDVLKERHKHVVFTLGNHEYYDSTREETLKVFRDYVANPKNERVHWLYDSSVEIDGLRFMGNTLWYPRTPAVEISKQSWSDFVHIHELDRWFAKENAQTVSYLRKSLCMGDVVVTHMLPLHKSVDMRYQGSPDNCFYVSPCPELIDREPALWIHGHTHCKNDYEVGNTHVISNPVGYPRGIPKGSACENEEFTSVIVEL